MATLPQIEYATMVQLHHEIGSDLEGWIENQMNAISISDRVIGDFFQSYKEKTDEILKDPAFTWLVLALGCQVYRLLDLQMQRNLETN